MQQLEALFSGFSSGDLTQIGIIYVVIIIWSIFWKGMGLWRASRLGEKPWFWALMIINTMGILEILYIYVFSKEKKLDTESSPNILKKK